MASFYPSAASIIPLDYGTHVEFSILLVEQRWDELPKLLAHPISYMATRQLEWTQSPASGPLPRLAGVPQNQNSPVMWTLKSPVMAEIRPITDRPDLAPLILGIVDPKTEPYATPALWRGVILNLWEEVFPNGLFVAEFAADTALLQISYLPPWVWPGNLYTMGFTLPTIGFLNVPAQNVSAVIHQDLQGPIADPTAVPTREDRANLIVDLLASREWYAFDLSIQQIWQTTYNLVLTGGTIDLTQAPAAVAPSPDAIQNNFSPPVVADNPQPGAPASDFVRLSAQLTDSGPMDACFTTQVTNVDGVLVLGDVAMKDYAVVPPPPVPIERKPPNFGSARSG